jgi:hypothetical protein
MSRLAHEVDDTEEAELRRLEAGAPESHFDALLDAMDDSDEEDDDDAASDLLLQLESGDESDGAVVAAEGPAAEPPVRVRPDASAASASQAKDTAAPGPDVGWDVRRAPAPAPGPPPSNFQRQPLAAGATARARTQGVATLPTPAFEKASERESFSGLAMARRTVSDFSLRAQIGQTGIRVLKLKDVSLQAPAPGAWLSIGVLSKVTAIEADEATNRRAHERWVLTDLHPERPSTMTVCLFAAARTAHSPGSEVGGVYAVLAPKLLPARSSHAPPTCLASSADGILRIGQAAELGRCRASCGSGACNALLHRARVDLCPDHLRAARAPPKSLRMDMAGTSDPLPPPKRRKEDGPPPRERAVGASSLFNANPRQRAPAPAVGLGGGGAAGGAAGGVGTAGGVAGGPGGAVAVAAGVGIGGAAGAVGERGGFGEGGPRERGGSGPSAFGRAVMAARPTPALAAALPTADRRGSTVIGGIEFGRAPNVAAGAARRPDPKSEVRGEFIKRGGSSAGARNVVKMLADVEEKRLAAARAKENARQRRQTELIQPRGLPPRHPASSARNGAQPQPQPAPPMMAGGRARDEAAEVDSEGEGELYIDYGEAPKKPTWEAMVRGGKNRAAASASLGAAVGHGEAAPAARVAASKAARGFFGVASAVDPVEREQLQRQIGNVAMGNAERVELSKT